MPVELIDLPNLVKKAWDAVVPPLTTFVVCMTACAHILGLEPTAHSLAGFVHVEALLPSTTLREVLDLYGVTNVVPLGALVAFFVLVHAVNLSVRTIASLVPVQLTPDTTQLLFDTTGAWDMHRLWQYHPTLRDIDGLNTLNSIMAEEVDKASRDAHAYHRFRGVLWMKDGSDRAALTAEFVKGVSVLSVLLWIALGLFSGVGWPASRIAETLAALAIIYILAMRRRIALLHAHYRARTSAYLAWKSAGSDHNVGQASGTLVTDVQHRETLGQRLNEPIWTWAFGHTREGEPARHILIASKASVVAIWNRCRTHLRNRTPG